MNPHWVRWIYSSISDHFQTGQKDLRLFIEGGDRLQDQQEGAELSINGPYFNNPSRGFWICQVPIIVLLNTFLNDQDMYKSKRHQGVFGNLFTASMNVYKFGPDIITDDSSFVGCLKLKTEILIDNLEQVDPEIRVIQSVLSGIYEIELEN